MALFIKIALLTLFAHSALSLVCYKCTNVQIITDKHGFLNALNGKSDPSCGLYATSSNSEICPNDQSYSCSSVNGEISMDSVFGQVKAKTQVRGCVADHGDSAVLGSCQSTDDMSNALLSGLLSVVSGLSDVKFKGQVCMCKFDYCSVCDGGLAAGDYCVKYWLMAVVGGGTLLVLILLVSCCCCCCGCCGCCCCQKKRQGMVLSTEAPSHTLMVIQPGNTAPNNTGILSVQSGDISRAGYAQPQYTGAASYHMPIGAGNNGYKPLEEEY